jgi:pyruvate dehydrogenase E2 component (dihydrolipoamide acetyltransferase)
MIEMTMPKLSDSMEEGTILKWLKQDGDQVARDEDLVEIETDKATMTYASDADGALQIVAQEGTTHVVGAVIARFDAAAPGTRKPQASQHAADVPTPPGDAPSGAVSGHNGGASNERAGAVGSEATGMAATATPLARRAARAHGVELGHVRGTGPRGRITRADVLAAARLAVPASDADAPAFAPARVRSRGVPEPGAAAKGEPSGAGAEGHFEVREPTRLQQTIARRMAEAKATIPEFEVQTEALMDDAIAMRARLSELAGSDPDPTLNDLVVKACAVALRRHPRVNASYADGKFKLHRRINVGFAVAAQDALVVPTLYDAESKSLGAIAGETRRLSERARSGAITPAELSGGTFTVSNLGMFGMTVIRPVINPPQAAILGVGAIRDVLARVDGDIINRAMMTLTLTADHRILYGADAARFLAEVRDLLESPLKLAL